MAEFRFRETEMPGLGTSYIIEVAVNGRAYRSMALVGRQELVSAVSPALAIRYAKRRALYDLFEQLIEEQWPTT